VLLTLIYTGRESVSPRTDTEGGREEREKRERVVLNAITTIIPSCPSPPTTPTSLHLSNFHLLTHSHLRFDPPMALDFTASAIGLQLVNICHC